MKKLILFTCLYVVVFGCHALAQGSNVDSLKLVSKISEDQLKLGKLKNMIDEDTKKKQDAEALAQKTASENAADAADLSADPDNKKLARKAENKADDAKTDARRARKATTNLDDLNEEIAKLTLKIAHDQEKLDKIVRHGAMTPPPPAPVPPAPTVPAPVPVPVPDSVPTVPDTTHHQ